MKPLKRHLVPLAQVKQTHDANEIQQLNGKKTDDEPKHLVFKGRGKSKNGGEKNDDSFYAIATTFDANAESGGIIPDYI